MKRAVNATATTAMMAVGAYLICAAGPAEAQGAFTRRGDRETARPSSSSSQSDRTDRGSLSRTRDDRTTSRSSSPVTGVPAPRSGVSAPTGIPAPTGSTVRPWGVSAPSSGVSAPTGVPAPNVRVPAPTGIPAPSGGTARPWGTQAPGNGMGAPIGIPAPNIRVPAPTGIPAPTNSGSLQRWPSENNASSGAVSVPKPFPSSGSTHWGTGPAKPFPSRNDSGNASWQDRRHSHGHSYWSSYPVGTVIRLDDFGVTIFSGYNSYYAAGQSYLSPFAYYGCPPFIRSNYVVTSPYPYIDTRELGPIYPYTDSDRYYSSNAYRGRALRAALNDLKAFWEENDTRALRRRILPDVPVAVYFDEQYTYSLRQQELLGLSSDALDRVTTLSFSFGNVQERSDGLVNAYARHDYRIRRDGRIGSATIRYTLAYTNGDWYISAVSMSPEISGTNLNP